MSVRNSTLLKDKRLLVIASKLFIPSEEELQTSVWSELKKYGLSAMYMLLHSDEGDQFRVKQLHKMGVVDQYSVGGVVKKLDKRPLTEASGDVIKWLNSHNIQIDACMSPSQGLRQLQCQVCHELGLLSDSVSGVKTAMSKHLTQEAVVNSSYASKHSIKSFPVSNDNDVMTALPGLTFPVVMKLTFDANGCQSKLLYSLDECQRHLEDITKSTLGDGETNSSKVVLTEYVEGTKYAVNIAVCRGQLLGGIIVQRGPAPLPFFHQTTVSVPGTLSQDKQQELVQVAFDCCKAVGLYNGVYDVDLIWGDSGDPKLLDINPRPGGNAIRDLAKVVYGVDIQVLHAILACGYPLTKADCNYFTPTCHGAAYLPFLQHNGEALKRAAERMRTLIDDKGIMLAYPSMLTLAEYLRTNATYSLPPTLAVCAFDDLSLDSATDRIKQFLIETTFFEKKEDVDIVF